MAALAGRPQIKVFSRHLHGMVVIVISDHVLHPEKCVEDLRKFTPLFFLHFRLTYRKCASVKFDNDMKISFKLWARI